MFGIVNIGNAFHPMYAREASFPRPYFNAFSSCVCFPSPHNISLAYRHSALVGGMAANLQRTPDSVDEGAEIRACGTIPCALNLFG